MELGRAWFGADAVCDPGGKPGGMEELEDVLFTEEPQVRLVQQSLSTPREAASCEREDHGQMCQVGNGREHDAALPEARGEKTQRASGVHQVLQHVRSDDDVEIGGQSLGNFVDVALDDFVAVDPGSRSGLGIDLHTDDLASAKAAQG